MAGLKETESGRKLAKLLGMSVDGEGSSSSMASYDVNNSRRASAAIIDCINAMPLEISHNIMACLPIQDAVAMSTVSKKWLLTWTSLPILLFDSEFIEYLIRSSQLEEFQFILTKVMISHRGPISSFYLIIPNTRTSVSAFIHFLMFILSSKDVKEIILMNRHIEYTTMCSYLFSCQELENLALMGFTFVLPHRFEGFRNLVSLSLDNIIFKGNSFNKLIASCPLLETVVLTQWQEFVLVDIVAPKLKYLAVSGSFEALFLDRAPNLMVVSITLDEVVLNHHQATTRRLVKQLTLPSKIERLTIKGYFCEFMVAGGLARMLPLTFRSIKALEFDIESDIYDEFCCLIWVLKGCPNVEELKISFCSRKPVVHNITFDPYDPLVHLREVEVTSVLGYSMELKFIEFLLLCSPALQKLYIEKSRVIPPTLESRMTIELLSFPRASPMARIIIGEPQN